MLRPTLRTVVACSCTMLLAACGREGGGGTRAKAGDVPDSLKYGGTVTVGSYGDLQSMNALVSSDNYSAQVQQYMLFMPLVKYDAKLNPVPWLAERWDTVRVAGDSIDLTFHLRRDVKWHDGVPTTARDVLFTFDRVMDPKTAFPNASSFTPFYNPRAQLLDDYTIRFRLRPHSDFLDAWFQTPPMPEHVLGKVKPEDLLNHPFGTQTPKGNGPFRFVRHLANQEWVFEANPDFPKALGGRPYVDRIVYRPIPEMTTLLTELLTGRVDVYLGPRPPQVPQIRANPALEVNHTSYRQWVYIAWNTRLPQFRDARVRRALTMAINRQQIVDALLYGFADVGRSTVTPAHWSYDPRDPQTQLPYDTAGARRLLTEAGWIDRNRDGVLEDAQGRPFRFTLVTNQGNDTRKDITEIVQAQLKPMGIAVEPRQMEWTTLISKLQDDIGGERKRDYDAVVNSWVDFFRKDDRDILHGSNLDRPYQYVQFANPRADFLIDTTGVMTDRAAALPFWKEYQHLMTQEAPYTVLYYPRRIAGVNRRLHYGEMDTRGDLLNAHRWWLDPAGRRNAPRPPPAAVPVDTAKK
ncbi:MAG TPA: ABC transporter substrate-binding protein [Longimicrobium sp.]